MFDIRYIPRAFNRTAHSIDKTGNFCFDSFDGEPTSQAAIEVGSSIVAFLLSFNDIFPFIKNKLQPFHLDMILDIFFFSQVGLNNFYRMTNLSTFVII